MAIGRSYEQFNICAAFTPFTSCMKMHEITYELWCLTSAGPDWVRLTNRCSLVWKWGFMSVCHYESFSVPLLGLCSTDVTLVKAAPVLMWSSDVKLNEKCQKWKYFPRLRPIRPWRSWRQRRTGQVGGTFYHVLYKMNILSAVTGNLGPHLEM